MAQLLPTDTPELAAIAVAEAARRLRAGQVVALPTETVYGLAADAWNAEAVRRIFRVKGRPATNPLIVHVADWATARACAAAGAWTPGAEALAAAFWPGPLTLVLPKAAGIPPDVTAGGPTVGLRWPAHALMQAVILAAGRPLAAPSANPSNAISPTTAAHVQAGLGERIPLIVDGGPCPIGIESTVVDLTGPTPRVLRPGLISEEEILAVWEKTAPGSESAISSPTDGIRATAPEPGAHPLRSPGQLSTHYAPRAPLALLTWTDTADLLTQLAARGWDAARTHVLAYDQVPAPEKLGAVITLPADPGGYAQTLYATLHAVDLAGAGYIAVEAPPAPEAWAGIRDRLGRAAS